MGASELCSTSIVARSTAFPQSSIIATDKHFMSPVKEGATFSHWCTDAACTEKYDPRTSGDVTQFYAAYI